MSVLDELRYALRALSHARAFTAVAVITLAIGVGSATLMFALVDRVLLEPLPVASPDRLVVAWKRTPTGTFSHYPFGDEAVQEVKAHARSFAAVAAFSYNGAMQFPAVEENVASYITTGVVDGDFFRVLDVVPVVGRTLTASDDAAGAAPVLVIDERLWARRYNRDPEISGKRLRLFDQTFTIVGVVPVVDLPRGAEAWISLNGAQTRSANPATREALRRDQDLVARLRPGVTFADATAELESMTTNYERRFGRDIVASVKPYREEVVGDVRAPLTMLFGATLLVLVIACANVANLLLLRGEDRQAQFALRSMLGAGRGRLMQQVGMEALVLCTVGAGVGVLVAQWGLRVLIAFAPNELPRADEVNVDGSAILFALSLALLATLVATIVPALFATTWNGSLLRSNGARITSPAFRLGRRAFVVTQVALSITVLAAAGVLTRTLLELQSADTGFASERMAFVELFFPPSSYEDPKVRRPVLEQLTSDAKAIPGVEAVVPIAVRPYAGLSGWDMPRWVTEGQSAADATRNPGLDLQSVYPEHFETMGIEILEGRALNQFDREGTMNVAVISENAARLVWPGQSALGKRLKWGGVDSKGPWFTIVGVAATTRYRELAQPRASVYLSAAQFVDGANSLAIRLSSPEAAFVGPLRDRLQQLAPDVLIVRTQSFADSIALPLARPRFVSLLANVFGSIALLLAAVGLYGVMAAFVRQSTREIGVRIALGATAVHVRRLVLDEAWRLTGIGMLVGLAGALAGGRFVRGLLYGVEPHDAFALVAAMSVMALATLTACYFPLRRATRVDPMTLLRAE